MDRFFVFFRNLLRKPKEVAWLFPSSKYAAEKVSGCIDFDSAKTIVELGCGTGSITKGILGKKNSDFVLAGFEINDDFCSILRRDIKDKRFRLLNAKAQDIENLLEKENIGKVDYVVCGIPIFALPEHEREGLLASIKSILSSNGNLILYLGHPFGGRMLKRHFKSRRMKVCWMNAPPIFINVCRK